MVCGAVQRALCVVTAHDSTTVKIIDPTKINRKVKCLSIISHYTKEHLWWYNHTILVISSLLGAEIPEI
jgi:hypothetical protein